MRELDEQHDQYVTVNSQILQAQETLGSLSAGESKEARLRARAEQEALHAERQRKQQAGQLLEKRHGEAAADVRTHQAALQSSKQKQKVQESLRVEKRTQLTGWEEQRLQGVAQLPESWREKGAQLTTQDLTQTKDEHARHKDFVAESAKLVRAEKRQSDIQARLDELKLQIDAIPSEERVLVAEVVKELKAADDKRKNADEPRRKAKQELTTLQSRQSMRTKLEKQYREESRQSHLHKRLARLLGREELQRSLMRATEREIVRLANVILCDLSRTHMQLRLRHEDSATTGGKVQEKQKALDLEFLNTETGPQWMDIELASGSQCFRIAISLALAMGSYFGRDACRVESVIIDEGFGCLDKINREDTIQVLNALQSTMKRIILVSHQDEFSHEFKNGYAVQLENSRSRVDLMVI